MNVYDVYDPADATRPMERLASWIDAGAVEALGHDGDVDTPHRVALEIRSGDDDALHEALPPFWIYIKLIPKHWTTEYLGKKIGFLVRGVQRVEMEKLPGGE